ncbi:MAG: choloylglycine hydrolase [Clostridia bacterium]|nr:choloylglycine hydrolase [Clostridia bacterium]
MCTALNLNTHNHYFGRNLDLDRSYNEEVCVTPRNFKLEFRQKEAIFEHYAMIGMATVVNSIPLYYDAANEYGLCMAGLNFPNNAFYPQYQDGKDNITPFEFIPWILAQCKTVNEAMALLKNINLVNIQFSKHLPLSPLHWIISDRNGSVTVESTKDGLHIYENPIGVLTNNPPFPYHLENLKKYNNLRVDNKQAKDIPDSHYCMGLGAVGLPGDVSSMSRFVRAAFGKENSVCDGSELASVSQFFHLLSFVEMPRGVCVTDGGHLDITVYSSCVNADKGIYYYTTYNNRQITCVDMHKTDLNSDKISRYPLILEQQINRQNSH